MAQGRCDLSAAGSREQVVELVQRTSTVTYAPPSAAPCVFVPSELVEVIVARASERIAAALSEKLTNTPVAGGDSISVSYNIDVVNGPQGSEISRMSLRSGGDVFHFSTSKKS